MPTEAQFCRDFTCLLFLGHEGRSNFDGTAWKYTMYKLLYLGLAALTESQIFLENLMYGIKGFSGAFGGLGTPFPLLEFRGPALWGLKVGLLYWPCLKGFDLNSQSRYNRELLKVLMFLQLIAKT